MATVSFLYRSTKSNGLITVRLQFNSGSSQRQLECKTRIFITRENWKYVQARRRTKDAQLRSIVLKTKREIDEIEHYILNCFHLTELCAIDKSWLSAVVKDYYDPDSKNSSIPTSLVDYIDYYLDTSQNELAPATLRKFKTLRNRLSDFENDTGETLKISDVNSRFKHDYETYMLKQAYSPTYILKHFRCLKTVCNHASRRGLSISTELDELRIKTSRDIPITFNSKELELIKSLKNIPAYLDNARDWLLISCYTGQRVSDFMSFNPAMLRDLTTTNGLQRTFIIFTQNKTEKEMLFPLPSEVKEILNKRKGEFPKPISEQVYNRYIKEVSRRAGIVSEIDGSKVESIEKLGKRKVKGVYPKWMLVSSHIGRRTFATQKYGDIPLTLLKQLTGHSSESQLLTYIGKKEADLATQLAEYIN